MPYRPERELKDHVETLRRGVKAQHIIGDLLPRATTGKWQSDTGRVYCGPVVICYCPPYDGAFIAAAHNLMPDILADLARMRRIEAAARELMAFFVDEASSGDGRGRISIVASDSRIADAAGQRMNALDVALGDGPAVNGGKDG